MIEENEQADREMGNHDGAHNASLYKYAKVHKKEKIKIKEA